MNMSGRNKRSRIALAISSALLPISGAVMSFNVFSQEVPDGAQAKEFEKIEITATRRASTLQEVPINISAITGDMMEQQNIENLEDVARWVPGLTITDQGGRSDSPIIVRGLNTNTSGAGSDGGTVATYLGELPLFLNLRLLDIERVEVLIGPQGTLYGAGTLGGAIRYIPHKADLEFVSGSVFGDIHQTNESDSLGGEAGFIFNTPLIDGVLGLRAAFNYADEPGYLDFNYLVNESGTSLPDPDWSDAQQVSDNIHQVKDGNDSQKATAKVALRWMPADWLDASLTYHYQKHDVGSAAQTHYNALSDDNPLSDLVGKYDSASRFLEPLTRKNELLSLEIEADLGFADLVSATGKSTTKTDSSGDVTDLLIRLAYSYEEFPAFSGFTRSISDTDAFTQEVRLVSKGDSALSWIVGAYYNTSESQRTYREYTEGFDEYAIDVWGASGFLRPDSIEYASNSESEVTEKALFGELSYAVSDDLDITLGLRQYKYKVETSSAVDLPLYNTVFKGRDPDSLIFTPKSAASDDDGTLFKINVSYRFSHSLMTYATVSEGFRIGGANRVAACPDNIDEIENQIICALPNEQIYIADTTTNYELGVKSTWFKSRFHFNVALFNVDWEDSQVSGITENGAVGILTNAEGANSHGIEISTRAMLSDYLTAYATYAYAKAELTADAPNIYGGGVGAYDGDRLPGSAEHQFSLGLNYQTELWNRVLDLNYGLTAQSDVYSTVGLNYDGETLPGYGISNINAKLSDDDWSVTFYVSNLFDKYSFISANQSYGDIESGNRGDIQRSYTHFILQPRTIGLKFNYKFGM